VNQRADDIETMKTLLKILHEVGSLVVQVQRDGICGASYCGENRREAECD